mmetsp:Transcript_104294/g.316644  ORF Transcript_104294/g.316644 Transcript_104294/m.316644 type:complete len:153 (+) Transcript_104294:3-461(+)
MDVTRKHGIDLFVNGHVHRQQLHHDGPENFLKPTAWIVSGGGGGITSEDVPDLEGMDDQYGFFELVLSKELIEIHGISHGGMLRSTAFVRPRPRADAPSPHREGSAPAPPQTTTTAAATTTTTPRALAANASRPDRAPAPKRQPQLPLGGVR